MLEKIKGNLETKRERACFHGPSKVSRVSLLHLHFVCAAALSKRAFYVHKHRTACALYTTFTISLLSLGLWCILKCSHGMHFVQSQCILCLQRNMESSMSRPHLSFCFLQTHSGIINFTFIGVDFRTLLEVLLIFSDQ